MGFNPVSEGVVPTLSLAAEELPEKYTPCEISTRESSMENTWLRKSCVSNIATHVILSYSPWGGGGGGRELSVNFRLGLPFVSFAPWTVCVCERDCVRVDVDVVCLLVSAIQTVNREALGDK